MTSALVKRKRQFWMILPVLVVPFLTFLFWKFGGGQVQAASAAAPRGLNLSLPDAPPKNQDNWTKLDYYKKAESDTAKFNKDPDKVLPNLIHDDEADAHEKKMRRKLAMIESSLHEQEKAYTPARPRKTIPAEPSGDIDKLETMMHRMQRPAETDPELIELNKMLDKLTAIENPAATIHVKSDTVQGLPVALADKTNAIASEDALIEFYGLPRDYALEVSGQVLIKTIVAKNITVQSGASVPLQLLSPLKIAGSVLPSGTPLFATANLQGSKLSLTVSGIIYRGQLLPVQLTAYDRTGVAGLAVQQSNANEFSRQSAQRSIGSIGFNSLSPTIEGQIAEAGLQTAKGLITKKAKIPTVPLRAGDEILLVDQSSKK